MDIKKKILELKDGEVFVWSESDYGKAEVWLKCNTYFLFEIPTFGGEPLYNSSYIRDNISHLIATVEKWS